MDIEEHMKLSREERQKHLKLNEPCKERGGNSTQHRGILVEYLDVTFPKGRILLCHACGNGKCSNPRHLYWGTDRENIVEDGKQFGTHKSPWERMVEKYGYEEACRINSDRKKGNSYAAGNKGKPKSEEHRRKISETLKQKSLDR
ncbi:MAG TPA: hypothetical protein VFM18_19405 [Methanosarcina sp.]|nr:hypothetical protein [Methanosarcina sp.]